MAGTGGYTIEAASKGYSIEGGDDEESKKLTAQTLAAAKAAGGEIPGVQPTDVQRFASNRKGGGDRPLPPSANMSKKGLLGGDISEQGEANIRSAAHAFESIPSDIARPLSAAESVRGLAELPGAVSSLAKRGVGALRRFTYEPPEKISLGPFGKIDTGTAPPVDPLEQKLPLPQRAHAEMSADLAQRAEAPAPLPMRARAEMEAEIAAGRQSRAAGRHEMYGDLAAARNAREPAGQEYPGAAPSSPTIQQPRAADFYEHRGADLMRRGSSGAGGATETRTPGMSIPNEDLLGRDIAERAARGVVLTPEEENVLMQRVQQRFTPETGLEPAAQKSGRIYAGRGTSFRPTNEQLGVRGATPEYPAPTAPPRVERVGPESVRAAGERNPVASPEALEESSARVRAQWEADRGKPFKNEEEVRAYARQRQRAALEEQVGIKRIMEGK